ncbi:GntR family transcriptional regulator [Marinomonas fungiae]|uniref:DNA-binding transcriptional regulator, GntR family n=1 Tax=Marinomonas fungiae TaxID=1137284 RepID=A0A0K6IKB2_9GAMM|nr:GntR family transcriptional regulator [Marinomonas fungiae]CUB03550.1 DNA-binding transcriptional regulator, GntR family [Marinomonas fungiae]
MLEIVEKKLVGQSVYEQLRSDIMTGQLTPGAKLKLNQLKIRYGASVNTLREALMRLVSDGFVRFIDQKGFSVQQVSKEDLYELLELRTMLELTGLEKSMCNSTGIMGWKSDLIAAHYRLSCMEELMLQDERAHVQAWERADRDFHMTMVANCGSNQMIRYHGSIIEQYMRYQLLALQKRPFRGQNSQGEHRELLDNILKDDVEGALAMLRHHIAQGANNPGS